MRRLAACVLGCVGALLIARAARAQQPPASTDSPELRLVWIAPMGCPEHDAVVAEIERLIARPLLHDAPSSRVVAVRVSHQAMWRAQLAIMDRDDEAVRVLSAEDCQRVANAVALILAVSLDPHAMETPPASPPPPSPPPPGPVTVIASPPPPPDTLPTVHLPASPPPDARSSAVETGELQETPPGRRRPERARLDPRQRAIPTDDEEDAALTRRRPDLGPPVRTPREVHAHFGTGITTDFGLLPGGGAGYELQAGVGVGGLRLALRGDYWGPRAFTVPSNGAVWRADLASVGVQACFAHERGAFGVRVCGALDGGYLRASSDRPSVGGAWVGTFAEAGIAWRPERHIAFRLDLGPGLTLATPAFLDPSSGAITYRPSTLLLRGALLFELSL